MDADGRAIEVLLEPTAASISDLVPFAERELIDSTELHAFDILAWFHQKALLRSVMPAHDVFFFF